MDQEGSSVGNAPDRNIQEEFLAPVSEIIRRVEIYESDAETPWRPDIWSDILVSGQVTADMGRDERRGIDLELDNTDGYLDPQTGGLWYDKIVKAIYGLRVRQEDRVPRIAIVEEYNIPGQGLAMKSLLAAAGMTEVHFNPLVETYDDVKDFDVLISISADYPRKLAMLTEAFNHGISVMTCALDCTAARVPYIIASAGTGMASHAAGRAFEPQAIEHPAILGWLGWAVNGPGTYRRINTLTANSIVLAQTWDTENGFSPGVILRQNIDKTSWIHVQQNQFNYGAYQDENYYANGVNFAGAMIRQLDYYRPVEIWECQIGEFMIDGLEDADEFNDRIKLVGRDYTVRCMNSKLSKATSFGKDEAIETIIKNLALNSGITKFNLPTTGRTLGKDQTWERDTERWAIMKEIAIANNYEIYFDATGQLTMNPQADPLTTPPSLVLTTGDGGNLVSRGAKTGAGQLYNIVTVIGESSDTTVPLVYAEARNNNPGSPSRIGTAGEPGGIGERVKNISSPLVTTTAQAQEMADTILSVSSLEEFELNFVAVLLPWIEPGEIVEMGEDESEYWGPNRYLISSLSLPMDLSPMSGNGKRVTRVT
jgi:hypothetical protein